MRSRWDVFRCGPAIVGGLLAACDGTSNSSSVVGPSSNGAPYALGLEINGPSSIPPGQSAQFTAVSRFSDGSTRTVSDVRWHSTSRVLRVDASGVATAGQQIGEDTLSAELGAPGAANRGARTILVLHDGTYRLAGAVTEDGGAPVVGARVELIGGAAVAADTDWNGRYRLYGVPGSATIRVSRDGYQTHVESVQLAEHATQDFQLALSGARLDLTGSYTLAIDVTCATSTPVPLDQRHLRYAASVTQSGSAVEVVLTEPRFLVNTARRGDRFSGRVDAAGATFNLGESFFPYFYPYDVTTYPNVVERLADGTFLVVDGTVLTSGSFARLTGAMQGFVSHYSTGFPTIPPGYQGCCLGTCYSSSHRFTLTRR